MQQEKKRTPGLTPHFDTIRSIKTEIESITSQIDSLESLKSAEFTKELERPERVRLLKENELIYTELKELFDKQASLEKEKSKLIGELRALNNEVKSVRSKNGNMSMAQINEERERIEKKMIDSSYTSQQEKEYQAKLLDLHRKKKSYGDLSGKEKRIHDLETALHSVESDYGKIKEDIVLRKKEQAELKSVLDGMKRNRKSPRILEIEKQIDALYSKKKELAESRKKEHEIIKQKEDEHAKYMEVMSKQIEIENQKKDQRTKVRKMTEELVRLEEERSSYDANKYDTIIKELKKRTLSVGLISLLGSEKLNIPRCDADYETLLKTLTKRKEEFEKGISEKASELDARIKSLELSIVEEKKVLESMPVTEISLSRKK